MSSNSTSLHLLESLNEAQREAVTHIQSPLLILAGAGSGKTRVISVKIAYLVQQCELFPNRILAVTFTNKAAKEMRERVAEFLGEDHHVMIKTFHSFGAWVLRRYAKNIGLNPEFSIYDDTDTIQLMQNIFPEHGKKDLKRWAYIIARAKDKGLYYSDRLDELTDDPSINSIYEQYQKALERVGNVDFGDLILKPVNFLQADAQVREKLHKRFSVILVDEYQDSNVSQSLLLRALSTEETHICVVGDDDQSIYKFRGAEVNNILEFPQLFPSTKIVQLEQNYRSTESILQFASAVVAYNKERYGKKLSSTRHKGKKPVLAFLEDGANEAEFCLQVIQENAGNTAILYRTNAQSRIFETALRKAGISYTVVGALKFWAREEVKDVLALLMLLINHYDEVAFTRIIRKPPRGIGPKTTHDILQYAKEKNINILDAMEQRISTDAAHGFVTTVRTMTDAIENDSLAHVLQKGVEEIGLLSYYQDKDADNFHKRVENIEELINALAEYGKGRSALVEFLETAELDGSAKSNDSESVFLLTMHSAKGLEFDNVIVTGMEDELFPGFSQDKEEERRLFYVAVTRAKNTLYLTSCHQRYLHARMIVLHPSQFLNELPYELYSVYGEGMGETQDFVGDWIPGQQVHHVEYGRGVVTHCTNRKPELVVTVEFNNGIRGEFLPRYASGLRRI